MNSTAHLGAGFFEEQYRLLVPVTDDSTPGNVKRRLQTAAAIARERGGGLIVSYIATFAPQTPLDAVPTDDPVLAEAREAAAELVETATETGVPAVGRLHLAHEEPGTVLDAIEEHECDGVVLAVEAGRSQRQRILRREAIEQIVARAECEVFVEKQATDETPIERILLAVSSGPHSALATKTAQALAVHANAAVDVVHFLGENATADEQEAGDEIIEMAESTLFGVKQVETEIERTESVAETIIDRSNEYDVTVLGSPTSGLLEQFVFGTVPNSVNQESRNAVVMVQKDTGSTSAYDRWVVGDPPE